MIVRHSGRSAFNVFGIPALFLLYLPLQYLSVPHSGPSAFWMFGIQALFSFGIPAVRHSAPTRLVRIIEVAIVTTCRKNAAQAIVTTSPTCSQDIGKQSSKCVNKKFLLRKNMVLLGVGNGLQYTRCGKGPFLALTNDSKRC